MRRTLAAALLAGTLALPAGTSHAATMTTYLVPTRHGAIYLEVVHPAEPARAPVVLTYSPYSALGRNGDAATWNGRGYARAYADVVGTGNSGGCYDYGGKREKETAYDLVEWIARQPWSTGKIGMIGGSYDGTTANAAAVMRPPHLTTIVPQAAISRWYDYAYSGGVRYTLNNEDPSDEGLDTPLGFDFGFAMPPPLDVTAADWKDRVASTIVPCDELVHTQKGYSATPDYDAFWAERDYAKDAHKVTIPVLVAHNWGDWNVKQDTGVRMWTGATRSAHRRLYMGTRFSGHGTPTGDYRETVAEWMDRWLKGERNGIEKRLPAVTSQRSDTGGAGEWWAGPVPKPKPLRFYPQAAPAGASYKWLLSGARPAVTPAPTIVPTYRTTESDALAAPRTNTSWLWFETAPLAADTRIFGSPVVRLRLGTQQTWTTLAVSLVDVDPGRYREASGQTLMSDPDQRWGVTRGWLDTRYRRTLVKQEPWTAGTHNVDVTLKPTDWTFQAGHRIGLLVTTEQLDWVIAKPYDGTPVSSPGFTLDVSGGTFLTLPAVRP